MMDFQQLQCELLLDRWRNERQLGQPRSACGPTNRISDVALSLIHISEPTRH